MHDIMLAKEIAQELNKIAVERKISKIKKVYLQIGEISMKHDGGLEHSEEIDLGNLEFGLKNIAKEKCFKDTKYFIDKVSGKNWKIIDIEVE